MSQWTEYQQPYTVATQPAAGPPKPGMPWWRPTPLWVGLLILSVMLGGTAAQLLKL